ncbi:cystin-1 isoform X1 [Pipistrellus kuhlii]|uniref:cystin-1 isoform X1 n=1 Tax=Pipistrellus kuhlii TaxID=59472 RepID=UPI001E26FD30|nr:cystin-1 isoform X1 [Pipistrellus kuhlii]
MGSGSSRSGRALRRLRGPDSRPAGPGGAAPDSAPAGAPETAVAEAREEVPEAAGAAAAGPAPGPTAPPDGRDETLRLLDQLLAESAAWAPGEPAPRRPARPPPAAGAGSRVPRLGPGTEPASQVSVLTGNRTHSPLVQGPMLTTEMHTPGSECALTSDNTPRECNLLSLPSSPAPLASQVLPPFFLFGNTFLKAGLGEAEALGQWSQSQSLLPKVLPHFSNLQNNCPPGPTASARGL